MSGDGPWSNQVVQRVVIAEISPGSGLYVYNGPPGLGDLIATILAADGNDPYTNVDYQGIASYLPNGTASPTSVVQLLNGQVNMGAGFQFAGTGGASVAAVSTFAAPGSGSTISLNSGRDTSSDNPAFINVTSADAAGGGSTVGIIEMGAPVVLNSMSAIPPASDHYTMLYADSSAIPRTVNGNDGGIYSLGQAIFTATATPQLFNSATAAIITGCTAPVGIGSYEYKAVVQYVGNQAAGTANFSVASPTTAAPTWMSASFANVGVTGYGVQTVAGGTVNSPTLTNGTPAWTMVLEGYITLTAAGHISLRAACSVAADTFNVVNAKFVVEPV